MGQSDGPSGPSHFRTTAWSVVTGAQEGDSGEREACLAQLCRNYWKPIYYYIRRRGVKHDDARDMAQEYFATFLEKDFIASVDRERGKFRTFVLVTLNRFLTKQLAKRRRQQIPLSVAVPVDEGEIDSILPELAENETPEDDFNRRWAISLLDSTLGAMEEACGEGKKHDYFRVFALYLSTATDTKPKSYREMGELLGLSESDVTNYLHRGRNLFQTLLRQQIRQSVMSDREVDEEIDSLKQYLAG